MPSRSSARSGAPALAVARRVRHGRPVSLAQIETFVAVAEEGTVCRAAARLRVAQPALSRRILELEHEVGAPLFQRTGRGMRLSAAGVAFLEPARDVLAAMRRAEASVARR